MVDEKFFNSKGFVVSTASPADIGIEFDYKGFFLYFSCIETESGNDDAAIKLAFQIAHDVYKGDVKFYAHLVLALNHRLWYWYEKKNLKLAEVYDDLWRQADLYAVNNFKGDDARYYYRLTD